VSVHQALGDGCTADSGSFHRVVIADLDGGHVLDGQNRVGRVFNVDGRDVDAHIVLKHLGKAGGVLSLFAVGDFLQQYPPKFFRQRGGVGTAADELKFVGDPGDDTQRGQVGVDDIADVGALHLDNDPIS